MIIPNTYLTAIQQKEGKIESSEQLGSWIFGGLLEGLVRLLRRWTIREDILNHNIHLQYYQQPSRNHTHLCQADHEEVLGLLVVELRQVSEHACQAGIVGAAAHEAHGEDGVTGDRRITVVRELGESVQDGELRVGHGQQRQSQRHCTTDDWVPIVKLGEERRTR